MGISAFLVVGVLSLTGVISCVVGLVRRGLDFAGGAIAALVGTALVWGGYIGIIGLLEGSWTAKSGGFWVAIAVGGCGAALLVLGLRGAAGLRRQA